MLLEPTPELEAPPKRGKTLIVSLAVHVLLVAFLVFDPGFFDSSLKRIMRVEGNDYDVVPLTELNLQPPPRLEPTPKPDETKPLPPPPKDIQPLPPPPPPPPPPPQHTITPEDILAEGAKPDGKAQASRGAAPTPQQQGGGGADSSTQTARNNPPPATPPSPPVSPQRGNTVPEVALNTNSNAAAKPSLLQQLNKITDQSIRAANRGGGGSGATMGAKTGRVDAASGQNFSADGSVQILSDTRGYDFGPYLNQVLNRIRNNWLIPDIARFGAKGRVVIDFTITKNGDIRDCQIISDSGQRVLDGAAKTAIDSSNPFNPLPRGFSGDELALRIGFFYNIPVP